MNFLLKTFFIVIFVHIPHLSFAEAIQDGEAYTFAQDGLTYAKSLYGEPSIPINTVLLRHAEKPYTSITDEDKGVFTIHLSREPGEYAFHGQLAHEIAHLLNAKLYDVYAEGLCGLFSEKLLKHTGKDWSGWAAFYREGGDPFYATTHTMMKHIEAIAGKTAMKTLLGHARPTEDHPHRMYIDINSWLDKLPVQKRAKIKKVILENEPGIRESMTTVDQASTFQLPQ